ncbi:hypothetical protein Ciccas_006873 [Cichlidogyrus casuarinus]|uniref:mitogen-activated protein kinase kinase n=1 Tax=Cichlidogyrus casuarinus TaxID=1844966 RepID=A0ABD2Q4I9_9PLAT
MDIKPHNLLLFDQGSTIKFCDFDVARLVDSSHKTGIGTLVYQPYETIYNGVMTVASDVYAALLVFWELLAHDYCFKGSRDQIMPLLKMKKDPLPHIDQLPEIFQTLLDKGTSRHPEFRPTSSEMYKFFNLIVKKLYVDFSKEQFQLELHDEEANAQALNKYKEIHEEPFVQKYCSDLGKAIPPVPPYDSTWSEELCKNNLELRDQCIKTWKEVQQLEETTIVMKKEILAELMERDESVDRAQLDTYLELYMKKKKLLERLRFKSN